MSDKSKRGKPSQLEELVAACCEFFDLKRVIAAQMALASPVVQEKNLLHRLRNPYGRSDDERRADRLEAADRIEAYEAYIHLSTADLLPAPSQEDVGQGESK
jgi:hypothetical protein